METLTIKFLCTKCDEETTETYTVAVEEEEFPRVTLTFVCAECGIVHTETRFMHAWKTMARLGCCVVA